MIKADSITFRHQGADRDALRGVSFQLDRGRLCCLMGVNGSGKSTLLALLCGIFPVTSGSLLLDGDDPSKNAAGKTRAALVPQDPDLYILGSLVEEDLLLALDPRDQELKGKALALAEELGLGRLLKQPVHTLSYGEKRKLCLASALASEPALLLLDEPFAGLDQPSITAMRAALERNRQAGITQVVTGHDLDLMADLADSFLLLRQGELVRQGGKEDVFPLLAEAGVRPPCWWFSGGNGPLWLTGKEGQA